MLYAVRPMQLEDIPQVGEIDRESFGALWPHSSYKNELLHNRMARYIVAWEKGCEEQQQVPQSNPSGGRIFDQPAKSKLGRLIGEVRSFFSPIEDSTSREAPQAANQRIAGFAGLWFMVDEAHLSTIAVREAYRRRGIGELLLISAIELALERNAQFVTLEVRASNLGAQALYQKYGFNKVGLRRGYYSDNHEDAVVMSTDKITSASYQGKFQQLKRAHSRKWG